MADKQQDGLSIKVTGSIPTGKVTANSTAPTTLVAAGYSVVKNGYTARLAVWAEWTNAGATNTTATFTLDDLAQPPSYSSKSHIAVLDELLWKASRNEIPADLPTLLTQFPNSFQKIIDLSRTQNIEQRSTEVRAAIHDLVQEILKASLVQPA
jgi:hypothetical protein